MKVLKIIIVFVVSFSALGYQINNDSAAVSLQRHTIVIGEQIKLKLQFFYNVVDNEVIWPEFDNYLTNDIEIIKKNEVKTHPLDSTHQHRFLKEQELIITSFEPKTNPIPPFEFKYQDSIYLSQSLSLNVNTVPVDTANKKLYDIFPIYEEEYPVTERIADTLKEYWYLLIILILIAIIIILYLKYKNKPKEVIVQEVKLPPHVKALNVLNELKAKQAWKNEDKKEYYSNLTDTVREYLEERFGIQALEKTTREIINDLKHTDISVDDKHFLREILKQADYVKFAKFKPQDEDGLQALEQSVEFVEKTKIDTKTNNNTKTNVE
ncbi:MAG TPA: hypothetical protein EYG85_06785 [Crocinitomix sp.]|nr:hypothetical protein [Crocinitomix sp.]